MAGDKRPLSPELVIAEVCRTMHWTYGDYMTQPAWLIDTILAMLSAEGEKAKRDADNAKSKSAIQ